MNSIELIRAAVLQMMIEGYDVCTTEYSLHGINGPDVVSVWNTNTHQTAAQLLMSMYGVVNQKPEYRCYDVKDLQEKMCDLLFAADEVQRDDGIVLIFEEVEWEHESDESSVERCLLFVQKALERLTPGKVQMGKYDPNQVAVKLYYKENADAIGKEMLANVTEMSLAEFGIDIIEEKGLAPTTVEQSTRFFYN